VAKIDAHGRIAEPLADRIPSLSEPGEALFGLLQGIEPSEHEFRPLTQPHDIGKRRADLQHFQAAQRLQYPAEPLVGFEQGLLLPAGR